MKEIVLTSKKQQMTELKREERLLFDTYNWRTDKVTKLVHLQRLKDCIARQLTLEEK